MSEATLLRPPRPSTILRPGARTLPIGLERFVVKGGGSLTVKVKAGDRFTLIDREGLQAAELSASTSDGKPDLGILGLAVLMIVHEGGHYLAARRFGELRIDIPQISPKMLTARLRDLEDKGVVSRAVKPTSPPSVEYALTTIGAELLPALDAIVEIGEKLKRRPPASRRAPRATANVRRAA